MLIELWFSKLKERAQKIVKEGQIGEDGGCECFFHPELFWRGFSCGSRREDFEGDDAFIARMLAFEEINTRVVRQLLDIDRRIRCGEMEDTSPALVSAVKNSINRVKSLRDAARIVLLSLFGKAE